MASSVLIGKKGAFWKAFLMQPSLAKSRDLSFISEEEMVALASRGDVAAEEELYRRYFTTITIRARQYYLPGAEPEDLIQEGLIGFMKAIRDFRPGRGNFRSFAELCIRRQLITALKNSTRRKHEALNYASSIDAPAFQSVESPPLSDFLRSSSNVDEFVVPTRWSEKKIIENAADYLSPFETEVLGYYLYGYDYKEIASHLGKTLKSIDSAVFKVKLKLRRQKAEVCGRT